VRASLQYASDGTMEAVKFPREGAGLLSSLADTDGIIELGEDVERVTPGESLRFLAYPTLM
jgi:molybdopterin molybdotransferase